VINFDSLNIAISQVSPSIDLNARIPTNVQFSRPRQRVSSYGASSARLGTHSLEKKVTFLLSIFRIVSYLSLRSCLSLTIIIITLILHRNEDLSW
jgi:hypothetical protein